MYSEVPFAKLQTAIAAATAAIQSIILSFNWIKCDLCMLLSTVRVVIFGLKLKINFPIRETYYNEPNCYLVIYRFGLSLWPNCGCKAAYATRKTM